MNEKSVFIFNYEYYYFININNPEITALYYKFKSKKNIPYTHPLSNDERWEFEERLFNALEKKEYYIPPSVKFYFKPEIRGKLREMDDNYRSNRMSWNMARFAFETEVHNQNNVFQ